MGLMPDPQVVLEAATAAVITSAVLRRVPTTSAVGPLRVSRQRRHFAEATSEGPPRSR